MRSGLAAMAASVAMLLLLASAAHAASPSQQQQQTGKGRSLLSASASRLAAGHDALRHRLSRRLHAAAEVGDVLAARRLQAVAAKVQDTAMAVAASSQGRRLLQDGPVVNIPQYNCTVLALVFGPLEPCAEPSCYTYYQIRRDDTTGDVECANVEPFPEAGPAEPEAPSLGFSLGIPYDYDYLFDASGDNVVVGASTVNEVANQDNIVTSEEGNSASSTTTLSTSNRLVPFPFFGTKGDLEGTLTRFDIGAGVERDGSSPLTFSLNGASGLAASALGGAYIPGTTYAVRDSSSDEGSQDNVAVRINNPALFGYFLGKK